MPLTPSFSGFAATPPTGQLYLQGAQQAQSEREFGQDLQLKKQQLANQYQIAEMETATRRQALQQEAMMKSHELEVQKAYQQAKLGLEAREIATKEQLAQDEIARAAQITDSRMKMQQSVQSALQRGMTPLDAMTRGFAEQGANADFGQAGAALINESQRAREAAAKATVPQAVIGEVKKAQGTLGDQGYNTFQASQNTQQLVKPPTDRTPRTIPQDPHYYWIANNRVPKPNTTEFLALEKKRDKMEEKLDGADFNEERTLEKRSEDPDDVKNFSKGQKAKLANYLKKRQEIADMEKEIARLKKENIDEAKRSPAALPPSADDSAQIPSSGQVEGYSWTTE